jgi:hypothetical protein
MNLWPRYLILILLLLFTAPAAVWAQSEDNIDANPPEYYAKASRNSAWYFKSATAL